MTLNYNQSILFDSVSHTYTRKSDGKILSGITSMLSRQLFADKYKGVSDAVLSRAAERGHNIHEDIDLIDFCGASPTTEEGKCYVQMRRQQNAISVANEYLISDNEHFASCIDVVWNINKEVWLVDIKTTSHIDHEYVSWQLSIYAYLFELQNPHLKVKGLLVAWLPKPQYGESQLIGVDRKSPDLCEALLKVDTNGEKFSMAPTSAQEEISLPAEIISLEQECLRIAVAKKEAERKENELRERLLMLFEQYGIKSWKTDSFSITYTPSSNKNSIDTKKLKTDFPDVYKTCLKNSEVKSSIKITVKYGS